MQDEYELSWLKSGKLYPCGALFLSNFSTSANLFVCVINNFPIGVHYLGLTNAQETDTSLLIISLYYIIVTLSTVGYGTLAVSQLDRFCYLFCR